MWQELDHSQHLESTCPSYTTLIAKMLEKDQIFQFLNGLNKEFEQVIAFVLKKPLLPLEKFLL